MENFQFKVAEKLINNQDKHKKFTTSETYNNLISSIRSYQSIIEGKKNVLTEKDLTEGNLTALYDFLCKAEILTEEYPALNKDKQRFGYSEFRNWYDGIEKLFDSDLAPLLNKELKNLSVEIKPYILECFGNSKRIDYGTGHELNFFCVLIILTTVGWLTEDSMQKQIQIIFKKYIKVCKHVQKVYNLEPAGSKGVYGLDDFFFLVFAFGAAELLGNTNILPIEIQKDLDSINTLGEEWMFFEACYYNLNSKSGNISLHSPILFQISNVPSWDKIEKGLIKMYEDEVMKKYVVTQHFYFGSILRLD